ncbi:YPD1 [Candida margitis]|uniref:YPD1 n=1 Tax=Candida margitis TaxID=1775924 RepID=UPI002226B8C9|nr:YPD1 [Candida margitis]KAI5969710.1 YPD1 [Candida margitis]
MSSPQGGDDEERYVPDIYSSDKQHKLQDSKLVDWGVFSEILQMDEDEEGFSQQLVETFVSQVEETFDKIEQYLQEKDLEQLSSSGHFLKGSAAALGLTSISEECERIQNYGHKINFDNFSQAKGQSKKDVQKEGDKLKTTNGTTTTNTTTNTTTTNDGESSSKETTKDTTKDDKTSSSKNTGGKSITSENDDESSDGFWIAAIEDALSRAKDGFVKTRKALDEFYA